MVENNVRKGEIAPYEQFLPFPQYFQKTCTAYTWKQGLVWERVKTRKVLYIATVVDLVANVANVDQDQTVQNMQRL